MSACKGQLIGRPICRKCAADAARCPQGQSSRAIPFHGEEKKPANRRIQTQNASIADGPEARQQFHCRFGLTRLPRSMDASSAVELEFSCGTVCLSYNNRMRMMAARARIQ